MQARRWVMARRPGEEIDLGDLILQDFNPRDPAEGEVLVAIDHHTVAPGVRVKMTRVTYAGQIQPGEHIPGDASGVVIASGDPRFATGDRVTGFMQWATHGLARGDDLQKLDPALFEGGAPLSASVTVFGMSGLTGYFGILRVGAIKPGEVVLISSAAGAVGCVVGQIAKLHGCDVVGIVGTDDKKADLLENCGFDDVINYRTTDDLEGALRALRPDGYDVFFDNVGGDILRAGFNNTRTFGRTVICGSLSEYGGVEGSGMPSLKAGMRQRIENFVVLDYAGEFPAARAEMSRWMREGKLRHRPTIIEGIENAAAAFVRQFQSGGPPRPVIAVA